MNITVLLENSHFLNNVDSKYGKMRKTNKYSQEFEYNTLFMWTPAHKGHEPMR